MTDHPILFFAPMVRAILDGRKTQTRRIIKPQPDVSKLSAPWRLEERSPTRWGFMQRVDFPEYQFFGGDFRPTRWTVGDRLWVRETWAKVGDNEDDIHCCPDLRRWAYYRVDDTQPERLKWRPSIHMPRWASRITLLVTAVRVERLQAITEADAIAEGMEADFHTSARAFFRGAWNSLYGPDAWDANPWVSVTEFERIEG